MALGGIFSLLPHRVYEMLYWEGGAESNEEGGGEVWEKPMMMTRA